jgi:hypothetical protein
MALGIAFGHLWKYSRRGARAALMFVVAFFVIAGIVEYHAEASLMHNHEAATSGVLEFVAREPVPSGKVLYVPFYFVPALHFYRPDLQTVGYDLDWGVDRLASAVRSPDAHRQLLCIEPVCDAVEKALGLPPSARKLLAESHAGYPLFAMVTRD